MAVTTIAPTVVGDAADVLSCRPVYAIALSLYVYCSGEFLCSASQPSNDTSSVYFQHFSCLSFAFIALIAYGVITDIASSAERGYFVSAVSLRTCGWRIRNLLPERFGNRVFQFSAMARGNV